MLVYIRRKKKPWEFKFKSGFDYRHKGSIVHLSNGYFYKTKDTLYKLSMSIVGIEICRLYPYQDLEGLAYGWFPTHDHYIEKIEFMHGKYETFHSSKK